MNQSNNTVHIYTDGACRGNPGPGGWGAVLLYGDVCKELKGYKAETTNNIMELTAAVEGLKALTRSCEVILTTDSSYVKKGITVWIQNWKKKCWKTSNKKPVKNKNLWIKLESECRKHQVTWEWVKGHSGHTENERADELANEAIDDNNG